MLVASLCTNFKPVHPRYEPCVAALLCRLKPVVKEQWNQFVKFRSIHPPTKMAALTVNLRIVYFQFKLYTFQIHLKTNSTRKISVNIKVNQRYLQF